MRGSQAAVALLVVFAAPATAAHPLPESAPAASISPCRFFPDDNIWNARVDHLPLDPMSATWVATIGPNLPLHPDFGAGLWPPVTGGPMGIPFTTVLPGQAKVPVVFRYGAESDPGPYPIPPDAPIEGGSSSTGDRHVLVVDKGACRLYELYNAFPEGAGWRADSGAVFDLESHQLRPDGWTSADAAGLPILPGLVRYEEVAAGEIRHAIRFTVPRTRRAYVWPARHFASSLTDSRYPAMGQRFRLKASVDISGFHPHVQVILTALKRYGMMLADNGSAWFITGAPDERWDNEALEQLKTLRGSDFEAVDASSLMISRDSGQAAVDQVSFFPHLGVGQGTLLGFDSSLLLVNTGLAAEARIDFFDHNGDPWVVGIQGRTPGASHVIPLETGQSATLLLQPQSGLEVGYARLTGPASIGGTAILRGMDAASGLPLYEAGLPATSPRRRFTIPVDSWGDYDTGLALLYPPHSGTDNQEIEVSLTLYDQAFQAVGSTVLTLHPGEYRAQFVYELWVEPGLRQAAAEMRGVLTVDSPVNLASVVLRQFQRPGRWYPDHVPLLTAFPVIPGVAGLDSGTAVSPSPSPGPRAAPASP